MAAARRALAVVLLLCAPFCHAAFKNFTIDDASGDERTGLAPMYTGPNTWRVRATADDCPECVIRPDPSKMHSNTWHESTTFVSQDPNLVTFKFTGTDLWVYCALSGPINDTATFTLLDLYVDGIKEDTFEWMPVEDSPEFQYEVLVLSKNGLDYMEHQITIVNDDKLVGDMILATVIMFDYAVYTADDAPLITTTQLVVTHTADSPESTPSSPQESQTVEAVSKTNLGLYLGLGIGLGLLAVIAGGVLLFLLLRRRSHGQVHDSAPPRWGTDNPTTGPQNSMTQSSIPATYPTTGTPSFPSDTMRSLPTTHLDIGSPHFAPLSDQKLRHRAGEVTQMDRALAEKAGRRRAANTQSERPPRYTMPPPASEAGPSELRS